MINRRSEPCQVSRASSCGRTSSPSPPSDDLPKPKGIENKLSPPFEYLARVRVPRACAQAWLTLDPYSCSISSKARPAQSRRSPALSRTACESSSGYASLQRANAGRRALTWALARGTEMAARGWTGPLPSFAPHASRRKPSDNRASSCTLSPRSTSSYRHSATTAGGRTTSKSRSSARRTERLSASPPTRTLQSSSRSGRRPRPRTPALASSRACEGAPCGVERQR